jgi:hypothetical protein
MAKYEKDCGSALMGFKRTSGIYKIDDINLANYPAFGEVSF